MLSKPMESLYLGHRPRALARTFAKQHALYAGYLRVVDHARKPFTQFFVFALGLSAPLTYPEQKAVAINGQCPWCGTIHVVEDLWRCLGPNPQAGMAIPPGRAYKSESIVAEFGLTWACEECREKHRLQSLSSVAGQVYDSPWYGFETAESKRFRQFRMIPPAFRWERDARLYVTLNADDHTITSRETIWEPI